MSRPKYLWSLDAIFAMLWCISVFTTVSQTNGLFGQSAHAADDLIVVDGMTLKRETFDRDPGWIGVNNRSAINHPPSVVRQDFGFSSLTAHCGGTRGEIGGLVTPAGEAAFYGKVIDRASFDKPLKASGRLMMGRGGTHLLLGFFNSRTVNEWRTPNTLAIRLNGRGDKYFAYVEYCTSKWRAGGDSTRFPSFVDAKTGRWNLVGYPSDESVAWSLTYDPQANAGRGVITATIGNDTAICQLDEGHRADGATFDRFGVLNVMKSVDSGSEVWIDDVELNGTGVEKFDRDPLWDGRNNRQISETRLVRPRFDFGFSQTQFAGGRQAGELGGQIFRGDCREAHRMASYGDTVQNLTLDRPLRASGKIALTRGVSDSTTLFGFYNSRDSLRVHGSQDDGVPECVLGIHVEGPSSEGFKFYPVRRAKGRHSDVAAARDFPTITPDRLSHDWNLEYRPPRDSEKAQVTVTLDAHSKTFDLPEADFGRQTAFDRFGIVTSWIDGNSQNVYLDDLTYTVSQH